MVPLEPSHKVSLALRLTLAPGPARPDATTDFIACRRGSVGAAGVNTAGAPLARPPHPMCAPRPPPEPAGLQNLLPSKQCVSHRLIFLIVFENGHISGALAGANPLDPSADQGSCKTPLPVSSCVIWSITLTVSSNMRPRHLAGHGRPTQPATLSRRLRCAWRVVGISGGSHER